MRNLFLLSVLVLLLSGCKKIVEQRQENMIVAAMTNGQWKIVSFTDNGENITPEFEGYTFRYQKNRTVDALLSGAIKQTGTWQENVETMSILANFTGSSAPLNLINGSWLMNETSWERVKASWSQAGNIRTLELEKLP